MTGNVETSFTHTQKNKTITFPEDNIGENLDDLQYNGGILDIPPKA